MSESRTVCRIYGESAGPGVTDSLPESRHRQKRLTGGQVKTMINDHVPMAERLALGKIEICELAGDKDDANIRCDEIVESA